MLLGLIRSMRPRQWAKNVFVFVALFFDRKLTDPESVLRTLAAFILLCLMSSAVYLMNDLADIDNDRQHPTKRNRPLAAGQLSPVVAVIAAVVLAVAGVAPAQEAADIHGHLWTIVVSDNMPASSQTARGTREGA